MSGSPGRFFEARLKADAGRATFGEPMIIDRRAAAGCSVVIVAHMANDPFKALAHPIRRGIVERLGSGPAREALLEVHDRAREVWPAHTTTVGTAPDGTGYSRAALWA